MASSINASTSAGVVTTADTSGVLNIQTAGTTAVTVDASQNVGVGVTTVGAKFHVLGASQSAIFASTSASLNYTEYRYNTTTSNGYIGNGGILTPTGNVTDFVVRSEAALAFATGGATERARIDSSGNLGIGTTSPLARLNASGGTTITSLTDWNSKANTVFTLANPALRLGIGYDANDTPLIQGFTSTNVARDIAMQTYGGNLLVGTTSNASSRRLLVESSTTSGYPFEFKNTASSGTPYGFVISYSGTAPNNTGSSFLYLGDNAALRFEVRSNGGVANYSANNVNLSDERTKTEIQNAGSYLAKICSIPVRTFKYKDQTDDLLNLGVIAQEVEAVAPELVDTTGFGETPDDGVPLKAIYQTDLQYALMKCIQEQQALITQLQADVAALKGA